jgi:NADH-quinone oxidoreductase subunit E
MLRRLHPHQPASFAFTPANQAWAEAQIAKYPPGRQASAIIPLLWRAQEQEGWLTRPAIEHVATMLGMPFIRALEVATFYFMFQLAPVGRIAHVQVCGTTTCMLCGAEDLIAVCKRRIARSPHTLSPDGNFSWEEVECLGACANAPMVQIGKDYYEDLTPERLEWLLDELAAGRVPRPGPQNGRFAAEPLGGPTTLLAERVEAHNASVARALALGDTVKRIDGTEVPLVAPWLGVKPRPEGRAEGTSVSTPMGKAPLPQEPDPAPAPAAGPVPAAAGIRPAALAAPRGGQPDDLKLIKGVGPKLEAMLHRMGIFHFDQIAAWTAAELAWVDANLEGFRGRASRDDWVGQAKILAAGGGTEVSARQQDG